MELPQNLPELWEYVHTLNKNCFPENNLMPILGGGKTSRPDVMFVFINPTHRNISSDPSWSGPRYPFIGTREVWRIFHRAGFLSGDLIERIENLKPWPVELALELETFLQKNNLYITNLVKWTGSDAALPDAGKIRLFLPIMRREIEIVKPKYIVAFGLLPFKYLTSEEIKLADYYAEVLEAGNLKTYPLFINETSAQIVPCYFPVGRGNPKRAVELLKLLHPLRGKDATSL